MRHLSIDVRLVTTWWRYAYASFMGLAFGAFVASCAHYYLERYTEEAKEKLSLQKKLRDEKIEINPSMVIKKPTQKGLRRLLLQIGETHMDGLCMNHFEMNAKRIVISGHAKKLKALQQFYARLGKKYDVKLRVNALERQSEYAFEMRMMREFQ